MKRGVAYYIYILASQRNGTLYSSVTNDLVRRVYEHRCRSVPGFTCRYDVDRLVWFESHGEVASAIQREKNPKHWLRRWKIDLIERTNPSWRDLYDEIAR